MSRQLKCMAMLIRMRLSHLMVFRLSFFGATLVDGTVFLIQLLMFSAIYENVGSIGGWGRPEMMIFIGTFSLINALNMVIYFFGINDLPRRIIHGELDHYLTKPMNPLLRLTFERMDFGSLPLIPLSLIIIISGARQLPIPPSPGQILGYTLLTLTMTLLWYDVELLLRIIPFFAESARNMSRLESLLELSFKIPGTLLKGAFKLLLCFILPYGIMSTLPSQALAGALSWQGYAYGLALTAGFTALTLGLWRLGLKHYKSASS